MGGGNSDNVSGDDAMGGCEQCNASGRPTTQRSRGADDSNKRQLATAAVTAGDGNCKSRKRQVKATAGTGTVTAGDSSCDGGQRRAKAALKMGDSIFLDGGRRPLRRRATAALTWWGHCDDVVI